MLMFECVLQQELDHILKLFDLDDDGEVSLQEVRNVIVSGIVIDPKLIFYPVKYSKKLILYPLVSWGSLCCELPFNHYITIHSMNIVPQTYIRVVNMLIVVELW